MVSIPKVAGVMSCGFLLCLGLSNVAQAGDAATDALKADQSDRRQGGQEAGERQMNDKMKGSDSQGGRTIEGEVLRVEGDNCFVRGQDGKEVRLHFDENTENPGNIKAGDRIQAKVDDQDHALSIRSPDRRNDKTADATTDATLEPSQTGSMGQ